MRLTLLKAKEALRHKSPEDRLEFRINRAVERYLLHGKYAGSIHRLRLVAPYGQLTLPRYYRTIEGIKVDGYVYEIANQWYEMLPGRSDAIGYSLHALRDLGDGKAIMYDLPTGGTLTMTFSGGGQQTMTIYGTDADALPVTLTLNGASPQSAANPFVTIDRVHKETGTVAVRLTQVAADNTVTNLAIMAPTEEETYYRRYMLDTHVNEALATVVALAKLRHIEFTSDQDILPITNIGALELGMDALQYEAEDDITLANQYWNSGVDLLNKELGDTNADVSFPVIRMIYPGGTTPRLTSRY